MPEQRTIHIATVHWLDSSWVPIQNRFLAKGLAGASFRIYGFLNGFDVEPYRELFHYINTEPIVAHITKLNLLAHEICSKGRDDDILIFIDGDAFPIANIVDFLYSRLAEYPLVAVQRLENDGDPQPHPCFCATTVGFWREIDGDWSKGPKWRTNSGHMRSDTGGVLWEKLISKKIVWHPMLRSNRINLHPLWFGIYGDLVYHHGAAFRVPYSTVDIAEARASWWRRLALEVADLDPVRRMGKGWMQNAIFSFVMKDRIVRTQAESNRLRQEIASDDQFYRCLI